MEDIFESTLALQCLTNSRADMVDFMNLNKVVIKTNAFSELEKNKIRRGKEIQKLI
jgi:hypothetical protein